MFTDRDLLKPYPFDGAFYSYEVDGSKPLDQQAGEEILVLRTKCDIQESSKTDSGGAVSVHFNVYFPFDKASGTSIKRGMTFKGEAYGLEVNGRVKSVFPTQFGGCVCYIEDLDA